MSPGVKRSKAKVVLFYFFIAGRQRSNLLLDFSAETVLRSSALANEERGIGRCADVCVSAGKAGLVGKVKVTSNKNIAGVGLCTLVSAGFF